MEMKTIIMMLAIAGVIGVAAVFLDQRMSANPVDKRKRDMTGGARQNRPADDGAAKRASIRKADIAETVLKKKKRVDIAARIAHAGLDMSTTQFAVIALVIGLVTGFLGLLVTTSPLFVLLAFLAGGLGLPHFALKKMADRRLNKFIAELPNALDVLVRGVKAGLPVAECLRIIATESPDPVGSEFRDIVEAQQVGFTLSDAIARMAERVPCSESNYLSIVVSIQTKSGGNLSEALGNLSRTLRERKKMKDKIKAMSMEAVASGGILAAMPPIFLVITFAMTPDYVSLLWTTDTGRMIAACSAIWMLLGVLVMRKMIRFEV